MRTLPLICLVLLAPLAAEPVRTIERVRPLFTETPLVRDGRPAVIAADEPALRPLALRLAEGIRARFGIELPVAGNVNTEALAEQDVIAIGNANDNAVIKRLYGMRLCYLDAIYPGRAVPSGGFEQLSAGVPVGWSFSTPTGPTHSLQADDQVYRSAPRSVRIDGREPGRACVMRNLSAGPGETVKLTLHHRGQVGPEGYGTLLMDAYRDQTRLDGKQLTLKPTDTWQSAALEFTVPAGANLVRCLLYLHNQGSIWYDDVSAEVGGRQLLGGVIGRVVHTVHNPFGSGHNAVVVGGSDQTGHAEAVDALLAEINRLEQPILPRLLNIRPGDTALAAGLIPVGPEPQALETMRLSWRRTLATNAFVPVRDLFQSTLTWARNYHLTGDRRHIEAFRALWRELLDSPASFVRNEMEWIFKAVEAWDLVEEDPALTEAERLEITQRLLDIGCANEAKYGRNVQNTNRLIADGHQLDQALCLYLHGLYFDRYYHINGHWMTMSKPLIDLAENAPRVHDSYAYGPIIGDSFMSEYALKTGNFGYFEKGSGKQAADWVLLCSDNLGKGGTFGDDGAWAGSVPIEFLSKAWGFYGDDRLLWPLQGRRPPLGCFASDRPAARPDNLLGVVPIPLHELLYRTAVQQIADPAVRTAWKPELVPPAQAFDKLSFRSGFAPEDQYLLIDGLSTIPHGHRDGASILRFTDNGRLFLTEGHYIEIAKERHNTLVVNRDGASTDPPPLVALEGSAQRDGMGLARLLSSAYNGVDWRRDIAWASERFFVVVDTITAREPGDYAFTLHWQTLGDARLEQGRLVVDQDGERFTIANLDGAEAVVAEELHRLGGNYYASYPHSRDGLVKHLTQTHTARLAAGQRLAFVNVLWTDGEPTPSLDRGRVTVIDSPGKWTIETGDQLGISGPAGAITCGQAGDSRPPVTPAAPDLRRPTAPGLAERTTIPLPETPRNWIYEPAARLTSSIAPRATSTWVDDYTIRLDHLQTRRDALVLWEVDQAPVLTVDLGLPRSLRAIALRTMWTTNSAKGIPYRFGSAQIEVGPSTSGPWTRVGELKETAEPALASTPRYALEPLDLTARAVRFTLAPQPGAALFLKGIDLIGPGAESDRPGIVPWGRTTASCLLGADLNGDGAAELLVGTALGELRALSAGGEQLWAASTGGQVTALAAGDLNGDGRPEILAGTDAERLICLGPDGKELWHREFGLFWGRRGDVRTVAVGEVDGQAGNEVVVGTESWHYWLLGPDGQERWRHEILHGATHATLADLDGQPGAEILAGHEYYGPRCLDGAGKNRFGVYGWGPWCTRTAAADLDGDGRAEGAWALQDDTIHVRDGAGKVVFDTNVGGFVTGLEAVGEPALLVAGVAAPWRNLVALGGDGKTRWRLDLPAAVTCLVRTDLGLAAGCENGEVYLVSAAGEPLGQATLGLPISGLAWLPGPQPALAAAAGSRVTIYETAR